METLGKEILQCEESENQDAKGNLQTLNAVDTIVLGQLSLIISMRLCLLWQKEPAKLSLFKSYLLCCFCEHPED